MDVVIAGAHGKIARALARRLVARGDRVRGLIRNPDHAADLREDGSEPVVCDLETAAVEEIAGAIAGAEAAVFAAGAGPGSGAERKWTVDRDGAIKLLRAAESAGAGTYLIVSSIGAEAPPDGDEVFAVYLRAKAEADAAVMAADLAWTVIRPVSLTDDPGTGNARIEPSPLSGSVSRDDVAETLSALLGEPRAAGHVLYVTSGDAPIRDALEQALGG
jgi:uncharacterized protein YbjT (DUF2867 family)